MTCRPLATTFGPFAARTTRWRFPTWLSGVPRRNRFKSVHRPVKSLCVKGPPLIFPVAGRFSQPGSSLPIRARIIPSPAVGSSFPTTVLPSRTYSLLPATDASGNPTAYAYMPNAVIITQQGTATASSTPSLSSDGYPIVAGYATTVGTTLRAPQPTAYVVRPASTVLAQGYFTTQSATAGDAGSVTLAGKTTILNGAILANALSGYSGGSIALSGSLVTVQPSATALPTGFGFSTPVPAELAGTLNVAASSLSGKGFNTIGLGFSNLADPVDSITASQVTLKAGLVLQAENIIVAAQNLITLEPGAQVLALALPGDTGQASLISPTGKAVIGPNAVVHASDVISLQTASLDLQGTLFSDHSSINLTSSSITFIPDGTPRPSGSGLFLTSSQWASFGNTFDNIALATASDLVFNGTFDLSAKNSLTIDAARLMDVAAGSTVTVEAQSITLQNTGAATPVPGATRTSQITLVAPEMQIGEGNILFDTFSTVNLNAPNDLTFRGIGSLSTGGGDLNIATSRLTTSYYLEPVNASVPPVYTAANFAINTGTGKVTISAGGGSPGIASTPGGSLAITAGGID